ncbi:hypothetical protein MES4922_120168 [Mesorhizobium ventifaucium]|uniref:Pyruvate oxidase n=1 Tax=Mesorhizobium ventifaucium TaxID=666020 RepID=A0ABN8JBG2_9HYPH|nr:hypothetical protein MES4922_120168 [Mesorhizobium ventifaucium]
MPNTAEILVDTLIAWDVRVIFGLPGDGINGIMEALRTRQDKIRFVQVRHEESAAFMATAYAKWTGKLGVCLATSGPGGTHLLTGLYDAKLDQAPVLAITGMQFHDLIETFTQQDVDLTRVFNDVTVFNTQVTDAAHMENVAGLACRSALAGRGVSHLSIASDVQEQTSAKRSPRNLPRHTPERWFEGDKRPDEAQLALAADILNTASKVAILAGRGALHAKPELERTAELLAAPVAKALLGKAVLPDDHPHVMGGIGILGSLTSQEIMEECEALLIVGSTFPYIEYYPKPGKARGVQIDRNAQRIGLRHPVEAGLVGDAAITLQLLNERLKPKAGQSLSRRCAAEPTALAQDDGRGGKQGRRAAQAATSRQGIRRPNAGQCDPGQRFRPKHRTCRPSYRYQGRTGFRRLGLAGIDGLRAALCDCRRDRLSGPAGFRDCGRWRAGDAAWRIFDSRALQDSAQASGDQEQHAQPDRLGADDVPRQPAVCLRTPADRFRPGR